MKIKIFIISLLAACVMLVSCSELSSIASQVKGVANLANCKFALKNVSNITLAGVNLKQITSGKISVADGLLLTTAVLQKSVPLAMNVNVNVTNPTKQQANVTKMDWTLGIEGTQVAQGVNTASCVVPANATAIVPVGVATDVYQLFSSRGVESLKSFAGSFKSGGVSSKMDFRIRPYVVIAGHNVGTPSYIKVI
ncbi:MAG: LEA type 2 family protein [Bacteroidales bacterium]|nr:LEA type 2 family protein [Candidatus Colimorpha onthohippi]